VVSGGTRETAVASETRQSVMIAVSGLGLSFGDKGLVVLTVTR
jgi:hypothetical protein